ncbi:MULTISPECIES: hypothetical protein [Streptomyces]|nr:MULTISPECIES: hypothetical protein [Streptomyces]
MTMARATQRRRSAAGAAGAVPGGGVACAAPVPEDPPVLAVLELLGLLGLLEPRAVAEGWEEVMGGTVGAV